MRNSVLLTSALAAGAVAMPYLDERAIRTHVVVETAIETVVVFVTVTRGSTTKLATSTRLPSSATPILSSSSARSSSSVGQPPIRTSGGSVSQPTGINAPVGTALASSSSSRLVSSSPAASSSSSRVVSIPPIIVSSPSSSAIVAPVATSSSSRVVPSSSAAAIRSSSVASVVSVAASPLGTSSLVARPTSIQAAPTSASSVVAPVASPSASPAGSPIGPAHLSGPQQATLSSGSDYQNAILFHHNEARANHKAAPLVWNTTCEDNARTAANMCNFAHYIPPGVSNGQNLFTVSGTAFNVTAGITESWYKSEFPTMQPYFGQATLTDTIFHQVGHLTQVVWQGTTSVGCVSIDCGDHMMVNGGLSTLNKFTVCNYYPPGNIAGHYDTGVLPPISTTNLGSWSD